VAVAGGSRFAGADFIVLFIVFWTAVDKSRVKEKIYKYRAIAIDHCLGEETPPSKSSRGKKKPKK
jgi:hypothetical protein